MRAANSNAVLPKKNRGETVSLALTLRYGNEDSLNNAGPAASMIPAMLMAGTKPFNAAPTGMLFKTENTPNNSVMNQRKRLREALFILNPSK